MAVILGIMPFLNCSKSEDDPCGERRVTSWEQLSFSFSWFDFGRAEFLYEATLTNICTDELVNIIASVAENRQDSAIEFVTANVIIGNSWTPTLTMEYFDFWPDYWLGEREYNLKQGYSTGPGSVTVQLKCYVDAYTQEEAVERFNASIGNSSLCITYNEYKGS